MIAYDMISRNGEREYNEDSIRGLVRGQQACFVLADGLGGHGGGDLASSLVADCVMEMFERDGCSEAFLTYCFGECQRRLTEKQHEYGREGQMKTTLVILLIDGERVCWGHIGDSRLYHFRGNRMCTRTLDHSVPQMLVQSGQIREKEIRGHEDRNRLLHVVGVAEDQEFHPSITEWRNPGRDSSFLLCSDGFWEWIVERQMQRCRRKAQSPTDWVAQMEAVVRKNGTGNNMDNYSAIAVYM